MAGLTARVVDATIEERKALMRNAREAIMAALVKEPAMSQSAKRLNEAWMKVMKAESML